MNFFHSRDGGKRFMCNSAALAHVIAGLLSDDGKFDKAEETLRRALPPSVTPQLQAEILKQVWCYSCQLFLMDQAPLYFWTLFGGSSHHRWKDGCRPPSPHSCNWLQAEIPDQNQMQAYSCADILALLYSLAAIFTRPGLTLFLGSFPLLLPLREAPAMGVCLASFLLGVSCRPFSQVTRPIGALRRSEQHRRLHLKRPPSVSAPSMHSLARNSTTPGR
jgi:hypothetical protein